MPESTASFKLNIQHSSSSVIKSDDNYNDDGAKDSGAATGGIIQIENQESAKKPASFLETKIGAHLGASNEILVSNDLQITSDQLF